MAKFTPKELDIIANQFDEIASTEDRMEVWMQLMNISMKASGNNKITRWRTIYNQAMCHWGSKSGAEVHELVDKVVGKLHGGDTS